MIMKKIIATLICASFVLILCAQNSPHNKGFYLKKSKHQRVASYVLAGSGAALIIIAASVNGSHDTTGLLWRRLIGVEAGVVGAGLVLVSVPFFISSVKNKHKAMSLSVKAESIPRLNNGSYIYRTNSSLSLAIKL